MYNAAYAYDLIAKHLKTQWEGRFKYDQFTLHYTSQLVSFAISSLLTKHSVTLM